MTPKLQKVLDSIRRGETELVWNISADDCHNKTIEVIINSKRSWFHYWGKCSDVNLWSRNERESLEDVESFPQNKSVKTFDKGKQFCQEWYNNYLIQEASKEMVA